MKRYIALALALVLVLSGCASSHSTSAHSPAITPTDQTTFPHNSEPTNDATVPPVTDPTEEALPETDPTAPPSEPPATESPATDPPSTEPPATEPPATEPPATEPPVIFTEVYETVFANRNVNIRPTPGTEEASIGVLYWGESITRIGIGDNGWSKVLYNGQEAYMYSAYLQTTKPVPITPTPPIAEPDPTDPPATEPPATEPPVSEPEFNITDVNETVYATSDVNIRTGPGTKYDIIGALYLNNKITRIGICDNGWSKVIYNDQEAYIHSDYLTTEEPPKIVTAGYPKTYSDGSCTITIYQMWYTEREDNKGAWCYAAHVQFSDYSRFGTSCANGSYNNGYESTPGAHYRLGAILTVNGCYSAPSLNYTVVRKGVIWNGAEKERFWCPAVYSSYTGLFQSAWDSSGTPGISGENINDLVAAGKVTDTFCFGPPILSYGTNCAGSDTSRAQRTFIGTNGNPGDLWIVVSDGRYNDGESAGLTCREAANFLIQQGCTFGVALDGGGSSTMVFMGKTLNAARGNERYIVDFVYFK